MAKPPFFVRAEMLPAAQLELDVAVQNWRNALAAAAEANAREAELRLAIVEKYFPNAPEGTNTGDLFDANLKAGIRINRPVDQEQFKAAWEWATKAWDSPITAQRAANLKALLEKCFKPTFGLVISAWRELDENERKRLSDIVTEKPGTPGLSWEPKKK